MDTGPLVAFINENDEYHDGAISQFKTLSTPVFSSKAVIAEAIRLVDKKREEVLKFISNGSIILPEPLITGNADWLIAFMNKYKDRKVSLADASLVYLSEKFTHYEVMTIDTDFNIYRRAAAIRKFLVLCRLTDSHRKSFKTLKPTKKQKPELHTYSFSSRKRERDSPGTAIENRY
jgi:predicted nucleic acid-binding protein